MPLSPCALGSVVARRMAQAQVCAVWGPLVPLPLERSGTGARGAQTTGGALSSSQKPLLPLGRRGEARCTGQLSVPSGRRAETIWAGR